MRSRSGGGGRSHSSSRSSFGRSHSSGSIGRSHVSRPSSSTIHRHHGPVGHGHTHYPHHHHRTYVYHSGHGVLISPLSALFMVLMFFCFIFTIIMFVNVNEAKNMLGAIQNDYEYYQSIIEYAETHPSCQIEGEIIGKYYDDKYDKYFIEYKYKHVTDYSFYIYDEQDINNMNIGDTILLACDSVDKTITINMDYKNYSLEEDGEYNYYLKRSKNGFLAYIGVAGIIAMIVIVSVIETKYRKKEKESDTTTSTTTSTTTNTSAQTNQYCAYCGSKVTNDSAKCSVCGATNRKNN